MVPVFKENQNIFQIFYKFSVLCFNRLFSILVLTLSHYLTLTKMSTVVFM